MKDIAFEGRIKNLPLLTNRSREWTSFFYQNMKMLIDENTILTIFFTLKGSP